MVEMTIDHLKRGLTMMGRHDRFQSRLIGSVERLSRGDYIAD
jgi:hypothetical protein